ncbi:hypothetical protein BC567DRAFT_36800 [Phyllosticta citribraziliensis]
MNDGWMDGQKAFGVGLARWGSSVSFLLFVHLSICCQVQRAIAAAAAAAARHLLYYAKGTYAGSYNLSLSLILHQLMVLQPSHHPLFSQHRPASICR